MSTDFQLAASAIPGRGLNRRLLALTLVGTMVAAACGSATETESVSTEPVVTEPVVTEPVVTEPVVTEPVSTEPVSTESDGGAGRPADWPAALDITIDDFVQNWNTLAAGRSSLTIVGDDVEANQFDSRFEERQWFGSLLNGTQVLVTGYADGGDVIEVFISTPQAALDADPNWLQSIGVALAVAARGRDEAVALGPLLEAIELAGQPPIEGEVDGAHFCIELVGEDGGFPPGLATRVVDVELGGACGS